jgi:hypothetical protein
MRYPDGGGLTAPILGIAYLVFLLYPPLVGITHSFIHSPRRHALVRCPLTFTVWLGGLGVWAAPALVAFAADAGAFAVLGEYHVGVAGVGVAPA